MKVGDYVRTKNGIIGKIIDMRIEDDFLLRKRYGDRIYLDNNKLCLINEIIKSSPNIIELFEEHDLVVIEYYSLRYKERVTRLFEVTFKDSEYINLSNAKCEFMLVNGKFNKGDKELKPIIKSIVTKEMFESMEYKVGE